MDQLPVDSHWAMPCQLTPLEPDEAGAAELAEPLLELPELLLDELLPELLDELPELLLEALATGLVPTAMIFGWAGVTAVRDTSVFALSAPFVVVTW